MLFGIEAERKEFYFKGEVIHKIRGCQGCLGLQCGDIYWQGSVGLKDFDMELL